MLNCPELVEIDASRQKTQNSAAGMLYLSGLDATSAMSTIC